jgi:hypothetical protein
VRSTKGNTAIEACIGVTGLCGESRHTACHHGQHRNGGHAHPAPFRLRPGRRGRRRWHLGNQLPGLGRANRLRKLRGSAHRGDQAIALACDGFDVTRWIVGIAQYLAQLRHGLVDRRAADDHARPHRLEQFFLADDFAGSLRESHEQPHGPRLELHALGAAYQRIVARIRNPLADLHGIVDQRHQFQTGQHSMLRRISGRGAQSVSRRLNMVVPNSTNAQTMPATLVKIAAYNQK